MKSNVMISYLLVLFVLNSCDLFGQDDGPKPKSTEFSFRLDTLKGITGSFEDLHIFDDTSFVIVGRFYDNNTSPTTSFNQIWWGKKRGVYYKTVGTSGFINEVDYNSHLDFINGTLSNFIYGGANKYSIVKNNDTTHMRVSRDIENPLIFTGSTIINENDFYLYGQKGVLGLHKNGVFHRIETNTDLDFTNAVWHGDSLLLYGLQVYETFKSEQAGLFVVKDTLAKPIDRWGYEQENKKPFYPNTLLWENDAYYFFGQEGIYRYKNQQFVMEESIPMGYGDFVSRNEGVFQVWDSRLFYYLDGEIYEQITPYSGENIYITKMAIKNDLWVIEANNYYLIIGNKK